MRTRKTDEHDRGVEDDGEPEREPEDDGIGQPPEVEEVREGEEGGPGDERVGPARDHEEPPDGRPPPRGSAVRASKNSCAWRHGTTGGPWCSRTRADIRADDAERRQDAESTTAAEHHGGVPGTLIVPRSQATNTTTAPTNARNVPARPSDQEDRDRQVGEGEDAVQEVAELLAKRPGAHPVLPGCALVRHLDPSITQPVQLTDRGSSVPRRNGENLSAT